MTGLWQGYVAKGRWRAPENGACSSGPKSSTTEEGYRVCLRSTFLSVSKKSGLFFRKRGKKGTLLKKVLIRRAFEEAFLKNRETFLRRVGRCSVRVNEDHRGVQRISQSNTEKTARMECAGPKGQPFHDHGTPLRATDKAPGKAKPSSL